MNPLIIFYKKIAESSTLMRIIHEKTQLIRTYYYWRCFFVGKAKLEQNQHAKPMSLTTTSAITGFIGGVFWGAISYIAYYFNFTEIRPSTVLEPWAVGEWKTGWIGVIISLIVLGVLGVVAAFLYYFTLKKFLKMWVSLAYGTVLFLVVFIILNPLFPGFNPITKLDRNTILTTFCLYLLFGMFVGYSISYEYQEKKEQNEL